MEIRFLDVIDLQKQSRAQKTFQTSSTTKNDRFSRQNIEILVRSWFFRFLVLEFLLPVLAAQEELRVQILGVFCLRNTLYILVSILGNLTWNSGFWSHLVLIRLGVSEPLNIDKKDQNRIGDLCKLSHRVRLLKCFQKLFSKLSYDQYPGRR